MSLGDTADQDILSVLEEALSFIQEAHEANVEHHVLVNCAQGVSRSASVVIAYLMKHQRMSLRDAYFHVRERRSIADPRKEFVDQLGRLEQQIFGLEQPTFTSQEMEAFEGRTLLNLDDRPEAGTLADLEISNKRASVTVPWQWAKLEASFQQFTPRDPAR
ncbi:unnamed protein product [Effrenium voratum]|nr:unnamed protein product [Effrenium voratum]